MAVATLQSPTRLPQNCIHQTSHLTAHHEELQVPSTQAERGKGVQFNTYLKQVSATLDIENEIFVVN